MAIEDEWRPPPLSKVRLDIDASVDTHGKATCGGLIRDHRGHWVVGFKQQLGTYPPTMAELMAIKAGLEMCQQQNLRDILVYSDSMEAINTLMRDNGTNHPFRAEVEKTRELLYNLPSVKLLHEKREAVAYADILAREAQRMGGELEVLF
ncbi:uncharacterized protein LOC114736567 [Neltuma alba]|uniref:uncharacterized protein LOC114736567 n=1 Tax=Neltuma alba TaxID=207710 RepID=UPI0010A4BFFC|nr:uncharacterized protein LOC114736567 [Prosopis alba]